MTLMDLVHALNRGEQVEITCHEDDANRLRVRFFKQVRTMPSSTAPLFCETHLVRGQLVQDIHAEKHLESLVLKSLSNLRLHAGRKTGHDGLAFEPRDLI